MFRLRWRRSSADQSTRTAHSTSERPSVRPTAPTTQESRISRRTRRPSALVFVSFVVQLRLPSALHMTAPRCQATHWRWPAPPPAQQRSTTKSTKSTKVLLRWAPHLRWCQLAASQSTRTAHPTSERPSVRPTTPTTQEVRLSRRTRRRPALVFVSFVSFVVQLRLPRALQATAPCCQATRWRWSAPPPSQQRPTNSELKTQLECFASNLRRYAILSR